MYIVCTIYKNILSLLSVYLFLNDTRFYFITISYKLKKKEISRKMLIQKREKDIPYHKNVCTMYKIILKFADLPQSS